MMKYRLSASALILASIIFLPYWFYLPFLLAMMIVFPVFVEGILFAFLIDILYGRGVGGYQEFFSPLAFVAAIVLMILIPVRERLRV